MRASTILLLLLSLPLFFSLQIAGISGNNVFFFDDSNIYVASAATGTTLRSIALPTIAGDVEGGFAYFATPSNVVAYRATSSLTPLNTLSVPAAVIGLDAKQGELFVIAYDDANATNLLFSYALDLSPSKVTFTLLNTTQFEGDVWYVFETPSRKLYFQAADGIYSYDGKVLLRVSPAVAKTPPIETPQGIVIGTISGELLLYSYDGLLKDSASFSGPIDALFIDGNLLRVVTSDGKATTFDISSFSKVSVDEGKDSGALAASSSKGVHFLAYPSAAVRVKDGFRARFPIPGLVDVEVKDDVAVALADSGGIPKVYPLNINAGCYLKQLPESIGYIPVNVSGKVWPPTSQQVGIRVGTETLSITTDGTGTFNTLLDPVGLPFGTLKVSCVVAGKEYDGQELFRDENLPKNTFIVSPLPEKASKGQKVSFEVRDAVGRELSDFSLSVDGQTRTASSPFTVTFDTEGVHTITLSKEGFETFSFNVEVPSFPILLVAVLAMLAVAAIAYFIFSHIG